MDSHEIIIGAAGALSGERTAQTPQFYYGAKLAVQEWNKVNSLKARIIWSDDKATKEFAEQSANFLINQQVKGIVGHFSSICAFRAAPLYLKHNLPLILPAATNPPLTKFDNVFRVCGRDDQTSQLIAKHAIKSLKTSKLALISDGSYYGKHHIELICNDINKLSDKNIRILDATWEENMGNLEIINLLQEFSPEAIIFSGRCHVAIELTNNIKEIFPKVPIIFGDDVLVPEYTKNVNKLTNDIWAVGPSPIPENAKTRKFIKEYELETGFKPGFYAAATYASVEILLQSIERSSESNQDIIKVIYGESFLTLLGEIKFEDTGEVLNVPTSLFRFKEESFSTT